MHCAFLTLLTIRGLAVVAGSHGKGSIQCGNTAADPSITHGIHLARETFTHGKEPKCERWRFFFDRLSHFFFTVNLQLFFLGYIYWTKVAIDNHQTKFLRKKKTYREAKKWSLEKQIEILEKSIVDRGAQFVLEFNHNPVTNHLFNHNPVTGPKCTLILHHFSTPNNPSRTTISQTRLLRNSSSIGNARYAHNAVGHVVCRI